MFWAAGQRSGSHMNNSTADRSYNKPFRHIQRKTPDPVRSIFQQKHTDPCSSHIPLCACCRHIRISDDDIDQGFADGRTLNISIDDISGDEKAVNELKARGYFVYSIEQCEGSTKLQNLSPLTPEGGSRSDNSSSPSHIPHSRKYAIIMGNEVKGVRQDVVNASDGCLEIPQFGTKHSLNVSTTAGMVIWEFAKMLIVAP